MSDEVKSGQHWWCYLPFYLKISGLLMSYVFLLTMGKHLTVICVMISQDKAKERTCFSRRYIFVLKKLVFFLSGIKPQAENFIPTLWALRKHPNGFCVLNKYYYHHFSGSNLLGSFFSVTNFNKDCRPKGWRLYFYIYTYNLIIVNVSVLC